MNQSFQLNIIEFPRLFSLLNTGRRVILSDMFGVYNIDGDQVSLIYDVRQSPIFTVTDEGLWELKKDKNDRLEGAKLINIFNYDDFTGKELADVKHGNVYIDKSICIFSTVLENLSEGYLKTMLLEDNRTHVAHKIFYDFCYDGRIYALDENRNLICYEQELTIVWEHAIPDNLAPTYPSLAPQYVKPLICGENILLNAGVDLVTQDNGKIFAFSKDAGNIVWEFNIQKLPSCFFSVADKCYMAHDGDIIILDGKTGEIIIKEPTGFDDFIMVYPFNGVLLCFSETERKLRVFNSDAKEVLQELDFPEMYYPSYQHGITTNGEYLYADAFRTDPIMTSASRGLIALTKSKERAVSAEVMPRVEMNVSHRIENEEKIYKISTDHDNVDEIIRFGEIWLRETACRYGYEPYINNPNQDQQHKGKLVFEVDPNNLPRNSMDRLRNMKNKLEDHLKEIWRHPGAGKDYHFKIEVRPI